MFDFIMTDQQMKLRDEAREFTRWVPRDMILAMDSETIQFPHEYLREAGKRNLLGIRIPRQYGGRGLGWVDDGIVAEEVGVASYSLACLWGVGADIVCEAVCVFGSEELKQEVVVPLLRGEVYAAEGLTEPRGRLRLFRRHDHGAEGRQRLDHQRPEALHRRRGRGRLVPGLRGHQPGRAAAPANDRLHDPPNGRRREQVHLRAHGRARRRCGPRHFQGRSRAGAVRA